MTVIYNNLEKLFDEFTYGKLQEQGANSEYILRTVYRSLNDNFLQIIQDSGAVERIAAELKNRAGDSAPEQKEQPKQPEPKKEEPEKKVVVQKLEPESTNPIDSIMEFTASLEESILTLKRDLAREYESKKAKVNQDTKDKEKDSNNDPTEGLTGKTISEEQRRNLLQELKELQPLVALFSSLDKVIDDNGQIKNLQDKLNETLKNNGVAVKQEKIKFNPIKVISEIKGSDQKAESKPELNQKKNG